MEEKYKAIQFCDSRVLIQKAYYKYFWNPYGLEEVPLTAVEVIFVNGSSSNGTGEYIKDLETVYDFNYINL